MNKQACVSCGVPDGMVRFEHRTYPVTYQQLMRDVRELSGRECVGVARLSSMRRVLVSTQKPATNLSKMPGTP